MYRANEYERVWRRSIAGALGRTLLACAATQLPCRTTTYRSYASRKGRPEWRIDLLTCGGTIVSDQIVRRYIYKSAVSLPQPQSRCPTSTLAASEVRAISHSWLVFIFTRSRCTCSTGEMSTPSVSRCTKRISWTARPRSQWREPLWVAFSHPSAGVSRLQLKFG